MANYRKKPIVIQAFQLGIDVPPEWFRNSEDIYERDNECVIHTLEGDHIANVGDFIIQGVKGELYPCKEQIFYLTYEKVE